MAIRQIPMCDRCGKEIRPNPALADLQGGPAEIRFPAFGVKLDLCEECMDELFEEFGRHGNREPQFGAARGTDQLNYLPFTPAQ